MKNHNKEHRTIHLGDHTFAPRDPGGPGVPSLPAGPWTRGYGQTRAEAHKLSSHTSAKMINYIKTKQCDVKVFVSPQAIPHETNPNVTTARNTLIFVWQ